MKIRHLTFLIFSLILFFAMEVMGEDGSAWLEFIPVESKYCDNPNGCELSTVDTQSFYATVSHFYSTPPSLQETYFYFDRKYIPPNASLLFMKFKSLNGTSGTASVGLYAVTEPWDKNTITWSNRPALGSLLETKEYEIGNPSPEIWQKWTIGSYPEYGLAIRLLNDPFNRQVGYGGFIIASERPYLCGQATNIIHVPIEQPTIQNAIDAAAEGDTVLVAPGLYQENINFNGKAILLKSAVGADGTIIDGNSSGPVIAVMNGESNDTIIDGFTIKNGSGEPNPYYTGGGGILIKNASPVIMNCDISYNNVEEEGGGIYCYQASPIITNCTISNNSSNKGGGIWSSEANPIMTNCTFAANNASAFGGAVGGIFGAPVLTNCILWNNSAPNGKEIYGATVVATFSDIEGGWTGDGNMDRNPYFVASNNYRLQCRISPCVNAGNDDAPHIPLIDKDLNQRVWNSAVDLGAYECHECTDDDNDGFAKEGYECGIADCDDDNPHTNPAATEICDGKDNDCDGYLPVEERDQDDDLWMICELDCDDLDSNTYPGAVEICDGKDNDCDGIVLEDQEDNDADLLANCIEMTACSDLNDADTDEDGILDGNEDANHNGSLDSGETDPCKADTDEDGIQDGTELGYTYDDVGPDTDTNVFQPDMDTRKTTDPLNVDSDGDGVFDGDEDTNFNGRIDEGETDPSRRKNIPLPWIPVLLK